MPSLFAFCFPHVQVLQGLQLLHVPVDTAFQPTSNARNEAMFRDATAFSQHIRTLEKDLKAMEKQITGMDGHETRDSL